MAKQNLFGSILSTVRARRDLIRDQTVDKLWKRNNLPPNAEGYRLAVSSREDHNGTETTEYRLYKLIDSARTEVGFNMKEAIEFQEVSDGKGK